MTDRYNFLTVALEKNTRSDDAEVLITAIKQLRGVLDVVPHISDANDVVAELRVRDHYRKQLMDVVYPNTKTNV